MANTANSIEKFWANVVVIEGGCWEWTGNLWATGYGRFHYNNKDLKAHRLSWEIENGTAGRMCVLHKCDNRKCVNPNHLFLGTRRDNNLDKTKKNRQSKGVEVFFAKITTQVAREIKASAEDSKALASRYGLTWGHINKIRGGRSWKHA